MVEPLPPGVRERLTGMASRDFHARFSDEEMMDISLISGFEAHVIEVISRAYVIGREDGNMDGFDEGWLQAIADVRSALDDL